MRISLYYKTERYREGKLESSVRRGGSIAAGESFAAWQTREEGDGVRFFVVKNPYVGLFAEDFLLTPDKEHEFTCTERYYDEKTGVIFDDVTEGTAKILS